MGAVEKLTKTYAKSISIKDNDKPSELILWQKIIRYWNYTLLPSYSR